MGPIYATDWESTQNMAAEKKQSNSNTNYSRQSSNDDDGTQIAKLPLCLQERRGLDSAEENLVEASESEQSPVPPAAAVDTRSSHTDPGSGGCCRY